MCVLELCLLECLCKSALVIDNGLNVTHKSVLLKFFFLMGRCSDLKGTGVIERFIFHMYLSDSHFTEELYEHVRCILR